MDRSLESRAAPLRRPARGLAAAAVAVLAVSGSAGRGGDTTATITVAAGLVDVAADGQCSLVEAIDNANAGGTVHDDCAAGNAGGTALQLQPGAYLLTTRHDAALGFVGLPSITGALTFEGAGATIARDGDAPPFRLLHVAEGAGLTLRDLWLTGGLARGGSGSAGGAGLGGAIANQGTLTAIRVTFSGHVAEGGNGSGLSTGGGHGAGGLGGGGGTGGSQAASGGGGGGGIGGAGGAGQNTAGPAPGGGGGGGGDQLGGNGGNGSGGTGGEGGAFHGGAGGTSPNGGSAGGDGGGGGGSSGFLNNGGAGGFGGGGGGSSPSSGAGGNGGFGGGGGQGWSSGGDGGFGGGGGAGPTNGDAGVGGFGGGDGSSNGGGGGAGLGGAIYNHDGATTTLENVTLSGNQAIGGLAGGAGAFGGSGLGGAIFNRAGTVVLRNATAAGNRADQGGGAVFSLGADLVAGGAGVATLELRNSILADSTGPTDCVAQAINGGSTALAGSDNLIEAHSGCGAPEATADPQLGPLQANPPGLTPTRALAAASPARGQGDAATCLAEDQRGVLRGAGACDLGAYELQGVDLTVTHAESADPVVAGSGAGNLVYTVTVTNQGPDVASGVEITETLTLPAGVELVSAVPDTGSVAGTVWTIPTVAVSATATLTVTLTAGPSAAAGADAIGGTAAVTGAGGTLENPGDDADGDLTSVARQVDLQVQVADAPDPVFAGSGPGNLVYTVTLANAGPSDASGVAVGLDATLPAGVTLDDVAPADGAWAAPDWTLAALAAGAEATLVATLTVGAGASPGEDQVSWSATVTAANEPLISTGDDAAVETTSIREPPLFLDGFESGNLSSWSRLRPPP